jgi:hypothetical protein
MDSRFHGNDIDLLRLLAIMQSSISNRLPDPRCFPARVTGSHLASLATASHAGDSSAQTALAGALHECMLRGSDAEISAAFLDAPSHAVYRHLWESVCATAERAADAGGTLRTRLFALPLILVTAATKPVIISAIVPGIAELTTLLEQHGAIGATRTFGLSNALCPLEALEGLKPSAVYRWSADWAPGASPREILPQEIMVEPGREQVHLRFLVGAGITSRDAPSFLDAAATIGAWGLPLTRALARQLAQPGLNLLPLPRPPVSLMQAARAGRCAQLELASNLFVSNTVRQFRATVGDPTVLISAHWIEGGAGEIRISMSSVFDDTLLEGFRWPLHPLDDLNQIVTALSELLHDCRVTDVRAVEPVLPGRLASGALFLGAGFHGVFQ